MEGARKKVILGLGISVLVLLSVLLIILLFTDSDKKKKKDDVPEDDTSVEIPKYLLSEITHTTKGRNRSEIKYSFEYDEFGRCSKVTVTDSEDTTQQVVYEFSYRYEDGEPYTLVTLEGIYEILKTTRTYNALGVLRSEERAYMKPDESGEDVVLERVLYDEKGREIQTVEYDESGNISSVDEYSYDAFGHTIRWIKKRYDNGEEIVSGSMWRAECDEKGRVVCYYDTDTNSLGSVITYFDDGSRHELDFAWDGSKNREYFFDSEGRQTKHVIYGEGDEVARTLEYEYRDTENGYMETLTLTDYPEGTVQKTDTEYDLFGKKIYEKDYMSGVEFYVVRDEAGRIISEERKSPNGRVTKEMTYAYDEEGKLISKQDDYSIVTYKYVPASLTAAQAGERAKFYFDEELYDWYY